MTPTEQVIDGTRFVPATALDEMAELLFGSQCFITMGEGAFKPGVKEKHLARIDAALDKWRGQAS